MSPESDVLVENTFSREDVPTTLGTSTVIATDDKAATLKDISGLPERTDEPLLAPIPIAAGAILEPDATNTTSVLSKSPSSWIFRKLNSSTPSVKNISSDESHDGKLSALMVPVDGTKAVAISPTPPTAPPPTKPLPISHPPKRPSPLALVSTSVDSHVPTLTDIYKDVPNIIVPAPAQLQQTNVSGWDTLRPKLSLPLLGKRKVRIEDIIIPIDDEASGDEQGREKDEPTHTVSTNLLATPTETVMPSKISASSSSSSPWFSYFNRPVPLEPSSNLTREVEPPSSVPSTSVAMEVTGKTPLETIKVDSPVAVSQANVDALEETSATSSWFWFWNRPVGGTPEPFTATSISSTEGSGDRNNLDITVEEPHVEVLTTPPSTSPPPLPSAAEQSLLMATPAARASWVNFFSSNLSSSLRGAARPIQGLPAQAEEEVMQIDFEQTSTAPPNSTKSGSSSPVKQALFVGNDENSSATTSQHDVYLLTANKSAKTSATNSRSTSPSPSSLSKGKVLVRPKPSNLLLPSFEDTFLSPPRSLPPGIFRREHQTSVWKSGINAVTGYLLGLDADTIQSLAATQAAKQLKDESTREWLGKAEDLPKLWSVIDLAPATKGKSKGPSMSLSPSDRVLQDCKRVVIIGIHGWFPGTLARSLLGAPTGTSSKFANMMNAAVQAFIDSHMATVDKITSIPLEGEGTIEIRLELLYQNLMSNEEWVADLHEADAIFIATHSQGSIASTQLLSRLLHEGHIVTKPGSTFENAKVRKIQRACLLALCGIHLGPLQYLYNSLISPYLQIFESAAATELFEFQDTNSEPSKTYIVALNHIIENEIKLVYIASLNDQVVPIYSGIFTAAHHPLILRALYIDGDAYTTSDFLSNLLVLLMKLRNAGVDDNGLLTHLSEATAGSLNGVGHSTAYEEPECYNLAVRYLFDVTGAMEQTPLKVEAFSARMARNEYEIPWSLHEIIIRYHDLFGTQWKELSEAFEHWHPKTTILRDMKRKLQPIQRLRSSRL